MFTIEIVEARVDVVSGVTDRGRRFRYHNQPAIVRCPGDSDFAHIDRKEVTLSLDDDTPLAVGVYQVSPRSFYVNRFGKVTFHLKVEPESLT